MWTETNSRHITCSNCFEGRHIAPPVPKRIDARQGFVRKKRFLWKNGRISRKPLPTCQGTSDISLSKGDSRPRKRVLVDVEGAYEVIHVPVKDPESIVVVPVVNLPIGVTFEEGEVVAVDVEQTPGKRYVREDVMVGDILRGTSAVMMQQTYPTMNLMLGGVGRPQRRRILFPTEGKPFNVCMAAILSNRELSDNVTLILERPPPTDIEARAVDADGASELSLPEGRAEDAKGDPVFDPRIFAE
eukprot:jgi/Botrbrau1/4919/Bobra.0122s0001.2